MARSTEDDILDDDIQLKDEYELDLADEEALLELDDDEVTTSSARDPSSGDDGVQYVDEEGNLVSLQDGDTLVVVDEYRYSRDRGNEDEDVLDVAVDPDFDSLIQESEDLESQGSVRPARTTRPPPSPSTRMDPKQGPPPEVPATPPRSEPAASPALSSVERGRGSRGGEASVAEEEEDDEEDDESVTEERRRGRFRAERRAGLGGSAAKKRQGIPDSLDSVISAEDAAKVDAYMSREDERRRAGRHGRGRGSQGFRPHQQKRGGMGAHRPGPSQQHQHIEPWLQFGGGHQGVGPRFAVPTGHPGFPGMAPDAGPRGKIFVNPQFRNGATHVGAPGMQGEGHRPTGGHPFAGHQGAPRGASHPFGGGPPGTMPGPPQQQQMPEPFLRPPPGQQQRQFGPPGGAMVGRGDPFATPMAPHMGHHHHQGPPGSSPQFSPAMERFLSTGRPGGGLEPFDMPQASRVQEFGGHHHHPHHPGRDEDFRLDVDPWGSPQSGRLAPGTLPQPGGGQQQQQHQHQQQQQQHRPPPPVPFGSPPHFGSPPLQQQPPPPQQQQHQHQQPVQLGGHPFPAMSQPFQGMPLQQRAAPPPPRLQREQQQQQQPPQHPPFQPFPQGPPSQPPPGHGPQQQQQQGGPVGFLQHGPGPHGGTPQQQPGVAAGPFGVPHFPQAAGPFGKRPTSPPPVTVPQKALRLEAPHMPRKHSQGTPGRTVNNANIKEVPIVENLPPPEPIKATLPKAIEEDSATKELRRKIEEQKKLREQVVRIKEERRKLAAMQRQKELMEKRLLATEVPHSAPKPQVQGTAEAKPPSANPAGSPVSAPAPAAQARSSLLGSQPKPAAITVVQAQPGGVKQRLGPRPPPAQPEVGGAEGSALKKVVIVRKNPPPQIRPGVPPGIRGAGNVVPLRSQVGALASLALRDTVLQTHR
ncbi:RNA-binding protein 33-like [Ixodes scapularis]